MDDSLILDLVSRPRRNRKSESIRSLIQENWVRTEDLVAPLFVKEGTGNSKEPIDALPGHFRHTIESLIEECEALSHLDIRAVALFPSLIDPALKTATCEEALNPNGLIPRVIKAIKARTPELTVITDIALDPYTIDGHDGVLNSQGTDVDNDASVEILTQMAILHAQCGVDIVAPSDMMDGRVGAIRTFLDEEGFINTNILSYTAKYNSALYGPFREAVGSAKSAAQGNLSKATYQMNPANRREAILEASTDQAEGADMLMVKPASWYLDVIRALREESELPIAAYQVSGEYAMIHASAQNGWIDLNRAMHESLLAIKRAGADMIFTYFAKDFAQQQQTN